MKKTFTVVFNFGSVATVSATIEDGETIAQALKRRSENIEGYIDPETRQYKEI